MSILVTGAAGLLGRRFTALIAGEDVYSVGRSRPAGVGGRWLAVDLSSPDFTRALPGTVDTVVHLAQSERFREFPAHAPDVFAVNVASTAALLDWARHAGATRFVLASSGGCDRDSRDQTLSYYLATKRSAELLTTAYQDAFAVVVLRFHVIYGPRQRASMLVPRLVNAVRNGMPITLAGGDGPRLNPVYVDDAAQAVAGAIRLPRHATIDIAGPQVLSVREMAEKIGRTLNATPSYAVDRTGTPEDLIGNIAEMRRLLHAPTWTFDAGLVEVLAAG